MSFFQEMERRQWIYVWCYEMNKCLENENNFWLEYGWKISCKWYGEIYQVLSSCLLDRLWPWSWKQHPNNSETCFISIVRCLCCSKMIKVIYIYIASTLRKGLQNFINRMLRSMQAKWGVFVSKIFYCNATLQHYFVFWTEYCDHIKKKIMEKWLDHKN